MNVRLPFAALAALVSLSAGPAGAAVTLVQDAQARAAIHVPARVMAPDEPKAAQLKEPAREAEKQRQRLRESVRDLALYLEKISGAKIEIVTKPPAPGDGRVPLLVGELANAFGPPAKKAAFKQGFRLVVTPKAVGFLGESDLATSYAVYELLDRLGCRWYMPSELGEVIPRSKTITLDELDFSSAPSTIYRGIWYADEAFKRRNRHGGLPLQAGHALEMYVTKEEREKHPEWVGIVNGKPHPTRLKWSNPQLAEAIAAKIIAQLDKDPVPSVSLAPDDGADWDESKEDRALDAGDFDPTFQQTAVTDRLMVLCNRVATRVAVKHPDTLLGVLAYVQYTRPPVREKVHPNVVPQIAPITYARSHPMDDDRVPGNKDLRYIIEGWAKKAPMTSIYFYAYFLAEVTAPQPMLARWGHDVPYVFRHNCKLFQPETLPNFETHMHALYLGCRLAWDFDQKPADVIREINERFYGGAAKEMTAYWDFVDGVWVNTPEYSGCGFGYLRRWTPERLKEARALLDRALAACKAPAESRRVRIADDSLRLFELFMKLRRDLAEGRFETLAGEGDAWRKQVVALGEKYKDQYCFSQVHWTKETVGGTYFRAFYQQTYDDATRVAKQFEVLTPKVLRQFRYQADKDKKGESLGWARADFDDKGWKATDVCLETWSTLGYHDYFKSMWYRTESELPKLAAGKKVYLWLGATDGSTKVFVNGKHVPYADGKGGTKETFDGYCQPASFDITAAVQPGTNRIALLCTRTFLNELGTGGLLAPVVVYREK